MYGFKLVLWFSLRWYDDSFQNYYGDSLVCLTTSLGFVQVGIFTEAYADQELGDLNVLVDTRRSRGWIGEAMKLGAVNAATSYSVGRS